MTKHTDPRGLERVTRRISVRVGRIASSDSSSDHGETVPTATSVLLSSNRTSLRFMQKAKIESEPISLWSPWQLLEVLADLQQLCRVP